MKVMISESWPLNIDFTAAVQNPQICFQDEQLRRSHPVKNQRGRILLWSGNFATVYQLCHQEQAWAVRCFTRAPQIDVQERYARIGDHLRQANLPYLVDFEFIDNGILVQGQWYPVLKMAWIEGQELDLYIGEQINDAKALLSLDQKLKQLKSDLQSAGIAHGDLQHGNIMVTNNGELKLVDYDGMYVPALKGNPPLETGHPNYQPPARSPQDFDESVDEFSFDVISLSLHALAQQPQLWQSFHEDNKNLIFRQNDFKEPETSPVFQSIATIEDPATKKLRSQLIRRCRGDIIVAEPAGLLQRLKLGQYWQQLQTNESNISGRQWLMLTAVVGLTLGLSALMATVVISTLRGNGSIATQPNLSQPRNSETNPDTTDTTATPTTNVNDINNEPEIVLVPITAAELLSAYAEGERDFANVDLSGEILSGTELNAINLQNALLTETDFSDARLGGANLTGAIAMGADLRGVDFSGADLTEANLTKAIMSEVNLTGARLLRANLSQADLNFAVLRGAELMRANLSQADLSLSDLSAANLLLANLNGANLLKANLQESNLSAAELENTQLEAAILLLADLRSANLKLANLNYADLRDADLSSADLTQANLIGANLSGANLRGTDVNQLASIDGADFTDVVNLADTTKNYFCKIAAGQTLTDQPGQSKATKATLNCPN